MSKDFDWSKFDKNVDVEALAKDVADASENKKEYADIPLGRYEVKVHKMELKTSKKGDPMVSIQFKIIDGQYKGQIIFYNQVVNQGFQIHLANELLRSLDSGLDVEFRSYAQYHNLILDISESLENENLEFVLEYGKNDKNFATFEIKDVFTAA